MAVKVNWNPAMFLGGLTDRVRSAISTYSGTVAQDNTLVGVGSAPSYTDAVYKAIIPNFLYKPPFGYPLGKDVPNLRRLSATPYVSMVVTTVCNELAAMDWKINARDGVEVPEDVIEKTTEWFYNPNRNDESFNTILRALVRDVLELDAGVLIKVRNLKDEFVEMYCRDGGTFCKNPDVYGIMPEFNSYYQYGWLTGARPIPFNKNELVYTMMNPKSDSIYGVSPVEVLQDVLQLLLYGIDSNLGYYSNNNIPKGVLQMIGANAGDIKAFRESWDQQMKQKDAAGKWFRPVHKMPIMNTDGKFVPISFSNLELQQLEQQKWFTKLVWGCFNVTSSELGFTEDSNRATDIIQSNVYKRKLIRPLVELLEYQFTTLIVNDLPWIKGKYEDKVLFTFDKFDLQEEMAKRQMFWGDLKEGLRTPNEIREELDIEEIEGGDELRKPQANNFNFGNKEEGNKNTENGGNEYSQSAANGTQPGYKSLISKTPLVPKDFEEMAKPDFLKKKLEANLTEAGTAIKRLIKKEAGHNTIAQLKAIDGPFAHKMAELINLTADKALVNSAVLAGYYKGLDVAGKALEMNFVPNKMAIDFLQNYTFENIVGLQESVRDGLRQTLQRGIMNGEGVAELSKRVDSVMDVGKIRAAAISRTESNRAENTGTLEGYKESGIDGNKEWISTLDVKTCEVCRQLDGQQVGLYEKFSAKGVELNLPPTHPNCRCAIRFVPKQANA